MIKKILFLTCFLMLQYDCKGTKIQIYFSNSKKFYGRYLIEEDKKSVIQKVNNLNNPNWITSFRKVTITYNYDENKGIILFFNEDSLDYIKKSIIKGIGRLDKDPDDGYR